MGAAVLASAATVVTAGATAGAAQAVAQRPDVTDTLLDRLFRPNYAAVPAGVAARGDIAADRDAARRLLSGFRDAARTGLEADDRQYLVQMVSARTGLAPAEAERRVAAVEADMRVAADTARRVAMHLSLWLVASMFLGALAASLAAIEGGANRDGRPVRDLLRR
jgi:hypothetical protein